MMKTLLKITCLMGMFILASCAKEVPQAEETEVSFITMNGVWALQDADGLTLDANTYYYLSVDRKEHAFEEYSNISTMYAHKKTGTVKITYDDRTGAIVTGKYDSGKQWDEYVVTMTSSTMEWTRKDDPASVQHFVRVEAVPQEIVDEARSGQDID